MIFEQVTDVLEINETVEMAEEYCSEMEAPEVKYYKEPVNQLNEEVAKGYALELAEKKPNTLLFIPFYGPITEKAYNDKLDQLNRQKALHEKLDSESGYSNVKSQYITCKACGSRLNKEYHWATIPQCPVCGADMHTETYHKRVEGYKAKEEQLEKDLEILRLKYGKVEWMIYGKFIAE